MYQSIKIKVQCDECYADGNQDGTDALQKLRDAGWELLPDGRHLCPSCKSKAENYA